MSEARGPGGEPPVLAIELAKVKDRLDGLDSALQTLTENTATADELGRLQDDVGELARLVRGLAEDLAEEAGARPIRAPWWPGLRGVDRREAWDTLTMWVDDVLRARHPEVYARLGRCWYRHPDVVDELSALRVAWHGAYKAKTPLATAALEWHDRWLPGSVARVTKALASCKSGHEEPHVRVQVDEKDLAAFISDDMEQHR